MYAFTKSALSCLLLALFAIQVAASAIEKPNARAPRLRIRQDNSNDRCLEYATLANLTAIGTNSTFRAAFMQASPDGSKKSSGILDTAAMKFMTLKMINDTKLNNDCGNLTNVSLTEAPKNFSKGMVGPFMINEAGRLGSGVGMLATAVMIGTAMLLL